MSDMLTKFGHTIVKSLSKEYGFDYDNALRIANLDTVEVKTRKVIATKSPGSVKNTAKIPLPFCGCENKHNCIGIRLNHGLYTQCVNLRGDGGYCSTCKKQADSNSSGAPTYGTIEDRVKMGGNYRDPKGKAPVRYGNVMEKLKITRNEAEEEAARQGVTIPEIEFIVYRAPRGRPKKDVSAVDTSDEETPKKKGRGRPKKEAKEVSKPVETELTPEEISEESDSEEETTVRHFVIDGKTYLRASDNTIYDNDTHEELGIWDDKKKVLNRI